MLTFFQVRVFPLRGANGSTERSPESVRLCLVGVTAADAAASMSSMSLLEWVLGMDLADSSIVEVIILNLFVVFDLVVVVVVVVVVVALWR